MEDNHYGVENFVRRLKSDNNIKDFNSTCDKIYDSFIANIYDKKLKINTAFGMYDFDIYNKYFNKKLASEDELKYGKLIIEYILSKVNIDFDFNISKLLSEKDIGIIIYNEDLFINIDPDIANWIHSIKDDTLLYSLATGVNKLKINTGLLIEFMSLYLDCFNSFDNKRKLLGIDSDLKDYLLNNIGYYKYNNQRFSRAFKYSEYSYILKNNHMKKKYNTKGIAAAEVINKYILDMGYSDSEVKRALKAYPESYSFNDKVNLYELISQYSNKHKDIENEYVTKSEVEEAYNYISRIKIQGHCKCNGISSICKELNINKNGLMSKLLSDINLHQAILLCIAERNKYNIGYFYSDYDSIDKVNNNKYSTKAFLRRMIELKENK